jgi:hypothetical protein
MKKARREKQDSEQRHNCVHDAPVTVVVKSYARPIRLSSRLESCKCQKTSMVLFLVVNVHHENCTSVVTKVVRIEVAHKDLTKSLAYYTLARGQVDRSCSTHSSRIILIESVASNRLLGQWVFLRRHFARLFSRTGFTNIRISSEQENGGRKENVLRNIGQMF